MEVQTDQSINSSNTAILDPVRNTDNPAVPQSIEDDFAAFMKQALGGDAKSEVNEEELFAALVEERLGKENQEAADYYTSEKDKFLVSMQRPDGYVSVENAALAALRSTVDAGKIDRDTAERINAEAFEAAQLDDNRSALYDSRGSEGDPTIAVANMDAAMASMRSIVEQIDSGSLSIDSRPLDSSPSQTAAASGAEVPSGEQSVDGKGGFLWKPVSESDGNLVVLLPTSLKGYIDKVEIHSELPPTEENKVAEGRFSGDSNNGGRPHFRFDAPGESYGSDVNLVVFKDNGDTVSWNIKDGAERYD